MQNNNHDQIKDLPPPCSAKEWSDRELLDRMMLLDHTPCRSIMQRYSQMIQNKTAHYLTSEHSGSNWAQAFYSMCILPYVDRSFYVCMKQQQIELPNDVVEEFERLSNTYSDRRIEMSDAANSKVSFAAENCFEHNVSSWKTIQQRMSSMDKKRVDAAYQPFIDMVNRNKNADLRELASASPSAVHQKVQDIKNTACKPYVDRMNEQFKGIEENQDNALTHSLLLVDAAHCYGSNLCGKVLHRCLNQPQDAKSFVECTFSDEEYAKCIQLVHQHMQ